MDMIPEGMREGKADKIETSLSSQLDTGKNARQVNFRLLGGIETVSPQGHPSEGRQREARRKH